MAMWIFTKAIFAGEPIKLFNNGNMWRDFTYVNDIVESVVRLVDRPPARDVKLSGASPDPASRRVYNIGNNKPRSSGSSRKRLAKKAKRELLPMQPGDVPATHADVDDLMREVDFKPTTPIADGITRLNGIAPISAIMQTL